MASTVAQLFYGTVVHSVSEREPLAILERALVLVRGGKIEAVRHELDEDEARQLYEAEPWAVEAEFVTLKKTEFLMPGFVDTHIHAAQFISAGTGYHLALLDWLHSYTFAAEARFQDVQFAEKVYEEVVKRTLRNGTTTASYFATIHADSCLVLADRMAKHGQRGFVGKVCMDRESPDYYVETTDQSVAETRRFIEELRRRHGDRGLVEACVTPRFAVSCTNELMAELGQLSKEYGTPIQTHLSENTDEIKFILERHAVQTYAEVYERAGLLTDRTILAHCVYSDDDELSLLEKYGCGVAHCPNSNITICSGLMDVRKLDGYNIKVGLGTDFSGGYSSSMQDSLRKAIETSKILKMQKRGDYSNIDHATGFYLATLGGARVMGLQDKIGNFEEGKDFDALLVDIGEHVFEKDSAEERLQWFVYCGDDRNVRRVYVRGEIRVNKDAAVR